jgi:hypothetical protein
VKRALTTTVAASTIAAKYSEFPSPSFARDSRSLASGFSDPRQSTSTSSNPCNIDERATAHDTVPHATNDHLPRGARHACVVRTGAGAVNSAGLSDHTGPEHDQIRRQGIGLDRGNVRSLGCAPDVSSPEVESAVIDVKIYADSVDTGTSIKNSKLKRISSTPKTILTSHSNRPRSYKPALTLSNWTVTSPSAE